MKEPVQVSCCPCALAVEVDQSVRSGGELPTEPDVSGALPALDAAVERFVSLARRLEPITHRMAEHEAGAHLFAC
jgi:hypothetical protein